MSAAPIVKGWCPGAYRPMMSRDGLVVRVRPRLGRLNADQVCRLSELAIAFGSGSIELTSRANLQLRGVAEDQHTALLDALLAIGLLDETPALEARRNITITPFWQAGDDASLLHDQVIDRLSELPALPAKMGVSIDTGDGRVLAEASADFRFERGTTTPLILRADGADRGCAVTLQTAVSQLVSLCDWFKSSGGNASGRMSRHLKLATLPSQYRTHFPAPKLTRPLLGKGANGVLLGAAFGAIDAAALLDLFRATGATGLRVTPWRMFLLEGAHDLSAPDFIEHEDDPLLRVSACPGAPHCGQAVVATREDARRWASLLPVGKTLHVSGCAKGCALPQTADITLVGAQGKFDLVRHGAAWDEPLVRDLSRADVAEEIKR